MFQQVTNVVTYYFCALNLLPYYFFCQKSCCIGVFAPVLHRFCTGFAQKSKKICQFFAIFSRCVSMIYEKVEKIICQKS